MQHTLVFGDTSNDDETLLRHYLLMVRELLPAMAKDSRRRWPVRMDHCFQRIVLDHVCHDVWYRHIARPAYKHMTREQIQRAVSLCEDIASGRADLYTMNRQSLVWRGKNAGI